MGKNPMMESEAKIPPKKWAALQYSTVVKIDMYFLLFIFYSIESRVGDHFILIKYFERGKVIVFKP